MRLDTSYTNGGAGANYYSVVKTLFGILKDTLMRVRLIVSPLVTFLDSSHTRNRFESAMPSRRRLSKVCLKTSMFFMTSWSQFCVIAKPIKVSWLAVVTLRNNS